MFAEEEEEEQEEEEEEEIMPGIEKYMLEEGECHKDAQCLAILHRFDFLVAQISRRARVLSFA